MSVLVDSNILIDVLEDDARWAEWSLTQLRAQSKVHELIINPIIYAELSLTFNEHAALDRVLASMQLSLVELPRAALFLAGKAFVRYRHAGGVRMNVLPDFFIGAHAALQGWPLLTRDVTRYSSYFPTIRLIAPV